MGSERETSEDGGGMVLGGEGGGCLGGEGGEEMEPEGEPFVYRFH